MPAGRKSGWGDIPLKLAYDFSNQLISDHLLKAESFAKEMDSKFEVLGIRFGYDVLLSLIPIIGPFISFFISLHLLTIIPKLDITFRQKYTSMIALVTLLFFDAVLGSIPVLGILIDILFTANIWIVKMLKADQDRLTMFSK